MLLGLLADHLGGDPNVCHVASLMRLVGTHNTKQGAWTEVTLNVDRPLRYELDDLEDWLTVVSPVIRRRQPVKETHGPDQELNPWLAVAERLGFKPPIDVEQRLAAMRYQGAGEDGIHATQVSVSAALLCRGEPVEEVVSTLLEATRAAAGPFGERWNWAREEHAIRRMCQDWLTKHPEIDRRTANKLNSGNGSNSRNGAANSATREETHKPEIDAEGSQSVPGAKAGNGQHVRSPPRKTKRAIGPDEIPTFIVKALVEVVRQSGEDLLLTGGDLYLYSKGVWRLAGSSEEQWLKVLIQQGADALGAGTKLGTINAAWRRLVEHPPLYRANVEWDPGSLVAVANGTLDLRTRMLSEWKTEHFLRRKLDVAYDPSRAAPGLIAFLDSLFTDRDQRTRVHIIGLLQRACSLGPRCLMYVGYPAESDADDVSVDGWCVRLPPQPHV
jgi:D5 N terminal like